MFNAAQRLYVPWAKAALQGQTLGRLQPFRPGTPPRLRLKKKDRRLVHFDLTTIENPSKHLHSAARSRLTVVPTKGRKTRAKKAAG